MTIEQFNKDVKDKFRSVRRFCRVADIEDKWPRVKVLLAPCFPETKKRREERQVYYDLAMQTDNRVLDNEIPNEDRKWLKDAVNSLYGSAYKFNLEYPQIPQSTVLDILSGRTKTKTQAYEVLMKTVIEDLEKI